MREEKGGREREMKNKRRHLMFQTVKVIKKKKKKKQNVNPKEYLNKKANT